LERGIADAPVKGDVVENEAMLNDAGKSLVLIDHLDGSARCLDLNSFD